MVTDGTTFTHENVSCSKVQYTQSSFYKSTHVVLGGPLLQFFNKFVSFPHCRAPVSQSAFTARHINNGSVHCGDVFVANSCEKEDGGSIHSAPLLARGNPAVVVLLLSQLTLLLITEGEEI